MRVESKSMLSQCMVLLVAAAAVATDLQVAKLAEGVQRNV